MSDFTGEPMVREGRGRVESSPLANFQNRVAEMRAQRERERVAEARRHLTEPRWMRNSSERAAAVVNVRTAPEHNLALRVQVTNNRPRLRASRDEMRRAGADRVVIKRHGSYVATYRTA
jgi:hypothetical protein